MVIKSEVYCNTVKNIANIFCEYEYNEYNRNILNQLYYFIIGGDIIAQNPFTKEAMKGSSQKGFYIAGGTGRGKTLLMKIFAEACRSLNVREQTISGGIADITPKIIGAKKLAQDFVKKGYEALVYYNYSICIDDVGAEPIDSVHMGNHVSAVEELVSNIYERGYGYLFITSNIPLGSEQFAERYGDRLQSRICEMCNYYEMRNGDFRIKK